MFRLLPHTQLAVLPGTDHWAPVQRPAWIFSMIKAFLDAPMLKAKRSAMNKSARKNLRCLKAGTINSWVFLKALQAFTYGICLCFRIQSRLR
jgi:hypothetical protein